MAKITHTTHQLIDLTGFIRRVFALNLPQAVWVAAELGQANESRGNYWLSLVQKDPEGHSILAQMEGVVWKSSLDSLRRAYGVKVIRDLFKEGMSVRLKVTTSFHHRYGLRLVVEDIDPSHTIGALEERRRLTLQKLAAEGLLAKNQSIPLSPVPQQLAIISSDTAAGLADFNAQLDNNPYGYQFSKTMFPAAMQGAKTGREISARLRQIRNWGEAFDAVVIIRGGGGRTDLAAFDDEELSRNVAHYPLPVIVGIGHETDNAVLDRVAHTSLKTPTATAVFLVERLAIAESALLQQTRRVVQLAQTTLYHQSPMLGRKLQNIHSLAAITLQRERERLGRIDFDLDRMAVQALRQAREKLHSSEQLLTALRPETTLARGYAMVSQQGQLITSPKQLSEGPVEIKLRDGRTVLHKN